MKPDRIALPLALFVLASCEARAGPATEGPAARAYAACFA